MAWERNDLESVSAHFHEDYAHTQYPDSGIVFSDIVQGNQEFSQLIENYDHKIRDISADGDVVFTHWVEDGTLKSDGTAYHVVGITMFKFRNGKIYTSITYTDKE
jgi:ketosteroid isomerase-like protein